MKLSVKMDLLIGNEPVTVEKDMKDMSKKEIKELEDKINKGKDLNIKIED